MHFKMVHSSPKNAKSRDRQSQVCYFHTTHSCVFKLTYLMYIILRWKCFSLHWKTPRRVRFMCVARFGFFFHFAQALLNQWGTQPSFAHGHTQAKLRHWLYSLWSLRSDPDQTVNVNNITLQIAWQVLLQMFLPSVHLFQVLHTARQMCTITVMSFIISANGGMSYSALKAYTVELMVDGVIHLLYVSVSKLISYVSF